MGHRKVVENYYADVNNLADLLTKLINSYRLLIGGAHELNGISLAHRNDIKDSIDRANDLGKIIDEIINTLEHVGYGYIDYCKLKSQIIKNYVEGEYIQNEIDNELKFKE